MIAFKYIYENEQGITCFDNYFNYLATFKARMPDSLAAFATDVNRYMLNSEDSLHDAWLTEFSIAKNYTKDSLLTTTVKLDLLLATHRKLVNLIYSDVTEINFSLIPDRWAYRPVDLLVHEFTLLDNGSFQHAIEFDRGVWVKFNFNAFEFSESVWGEHMMP